MKTTKTTGVRPGYADLARNKQNEFKVRGSFLPSALPIIAASLLAMAGTATIGCNRTTDTPVRSPNLSNPVPSATNTDPNAPGSVSGASTSATDTTTTDTAAPTTATGTTSNTDTPTTTDKSAKTTTTKKAKHRNHPKTSQHSMSHKNRSTSYYRSSKTTQRTAPVVSAEPVPMQPVTTSDETVSGSTTSASDMGSQRSPANTTGLMNAPGRFASALTDWGVDVRINDAKAAQ